MCFENNRNPLLDVKPIEVSGNRGSYGSLSPINADGGATSSNDHERAGTLVSTDTEHPGNNSNSNLLDKLRVHGRGWFAYVKTRHFWLVLLLGQLLSFGVTGMNTMSALLSSAGVSIPAFQLLPNYILLNLVYTGFTLYRYGLRRYSELLIKDGWRYMILAFLDVEGNYFVVLAYRYTTILSAQLINFWAIVVVVFVSFAVLKVRYRPAQYAGIVICIGGMGVLIASDHITGVNSNGGSEHVKGDLFALLGATLYGLTNVFEEFLVSKRPLYEVIGQVGLWGSIISGTHTAIFDRAQWREAKWTAPVWGYFAGFSGILFAFYSLVPMLLRLASAAFFNISLLTANFWGLLIGVWMFAYSVRWMYPVAFIMIVFGLIVYFATESVMGEARKPWLGELQEDGANGIGTARWISKRRRRRCKSKVGTEHHSDSQ